MSATLSAPELRATQEKVNGQANPWVSGPAVVLYLAAFKLLLHLLVAQKYGYMQDELYFLACSEHIDWGYVDHPPLIVFVAKVVRMLIGDSLLALRLLPAIAGAALVCLTGAITRTLGGGRFAQALAAMGVIATPMYLTVHYVFSMNAIEPLFWTGLAYVVLLAVKRANPRLLIWVGVLLGFGLLNKYSVAIFALALALGLLFTEHRKLLASKWLWMGLGIGFLTFTPHLNWLIVHHFPFLEWQRNIRIGLPSPSLPFLDWQHNVPSPPQLIQYSAWQFISQQLFFTGTASLMWLAGVVFFFGTSQGKPYRFLGWAFVITLAFIAAAHGKCYYAAPVYAVAIASGAVILEKWSARGGWERFRAPLAAAIIAGASLLSPMFIPLLPIDSLVRYQTKIGMHPTADQQYMLSSPLSPYFTLQFGWPTLVAKVASVYGRLPPDEKSHATIFGRTYSDASAVDFFGKQYGLPKAISGHVSYYLWGPGKNASDVVIFVGYTPRDVAPFCNQLEIGEQMYDPYAYPDEMNKPVMVCRGLVVDLQKQWPRFKLWY